MEEQFNFDLSFDFLDASTSNVKPNATISTSYPQTPNPHVLDVETLASKIASVNDLVLQLKTEKEERAKIRKQMQDLSESAMSIQRLYEQEKMEKAKHALLLQDFKDKCELAESQLANKTFHFEQLSSKIEQSAEKGPISYNELTLRYHRLALCLDEDKQLNHKEKQKLQQIQEYMESKKLVALAPFKRKKKQPLESKPEKCDQGTQYSPEMASKCTFTDIEVIQKKMVSQGTQHTWYTTTRGTNTENQNARREMKTQGTQYISSTTTRSTSTLGFIKTHSVGTNFPDESTKLVEDIFSEMIYDIRPLSPLAEEEIPPADRVVMKTVGTITGLRNVRKAIDYVTPVNIKSSDSRPPSRNMFERVKNEVPFMGIPTMNSFVDLGGNSSSVPNNITELWNLLGHTFFSLLQNVNTFNNSMNLNGINDRMRNTTSNDDQPRNNGGGYFEETCRNSSSPRGFLGTTRSTATSPIAELENATIREQGFGNEVSCAKVPNPPNTGVADHVNPSTPVEIQKIILNRMFHGETSAAATSQLGEQSLQTHRSQMSKRGSKKSRKKCKSCRENIVNENVESQPEYSPSEKSRSQIVTSCTVGTQFNDSNVTKIGNGTTSGSGLRSEDYRSLSLDSLENLQSVNINLEKELFGASDDELPHSEQISNSTPPAAGSTPNDRTTEEKSDSDVFCKPFMPKKRKLTNSLDTRMFHIEELKAVQQWPVENSSAESRISKKKAKRKRSAAKSLNRFSKVRVCSESAFDNYSEDVRNSVKFVTNGSLNEKSPSVTLIVDSYDSAPMTPQSVVLNPDAQARGTIPEMYESSECSSSALRKSGGAVSNEAQSGLNPDLNVIFREELGQMKKMSSEDDNVSAKSTEMPAITQQHVSRQCEVISVIDVSLKKPPALIPIQSGIESTETNLPSQISELKMLPLVSTIQNAKSNSLINELPEKSSVATVPSKENERDIFENKTNTPCTSSIPEPRQMSPEAIKPLCQASTLSECEPEAFTSDDSSDQSQQSTSSMSESKWAIPASYSNQTCNSRNSFENLLLDESNDSFQEIIHQICDEFATPERPVSAIPPCESSDGEDSFCEEINVPGVAATVKEKTRKRKGCSAVTAVKRSERLKAKNSIQEAIKYSSLKIPAIEIGKYTRKKTEPKSACDDVIEEKALPSPKQSDPEMVTASECRLGFFKDVFSEEPRVQESSVYAESKRIDLPTQNVMPDSEVDATSDLVIDLEDEANAIQVPAEVHLSPEESKTYHPPAETMPSQPPPTSFNFDEPPSSPPPGDREPEADHSPLQVTERISKHAKTNSLLSQIIVNYNHEYHKKVMNSRKEHDKAIIKQLQTTLTAFAKVTCEGEDIIRVVETICCITNCEQLLAHGLITVVKTAPRPESESPTPVPDLYLSQVLRKVISLLDPLYARLPHLRTALLTNIEKSIFSFTKDFVTLDMTLNLTQFYLAAIADVDSPSNPARLFICKCLFFYTKKAIPMIYETLCVYPSVLPHRDDPNYDRSDALISTIQCLLMSTYYDTEKSDLKAKQMFHKLRNFYNYECLKPSREDVIDNLVAKLRAGRFKNVSYSFAIICKRMDQKDIEKTILGERLLPLANEYYQTISATAENDQRIACVLECISYVIKPFPVETDITTYINLFSRFLNTTDRQAVQEAAISAVLRTIRFGYVQCFRTIYNFQPKYEISDQTKVMIRSFVYKKTLDYLRTLENQMQVLTQ